MTPFKTLILTVMGAILWGSCLAQPAEVVGDSHLSFPSHVERYLSKLGWHKAAFKNGMICFYPAELTLPADMHDPKISDRRVSDVKKNSNIEHQEEQEVLSEFFSKNCGTAYLATTVPGEKGSTITATVAATSAATSTDDAFADSMNNDAITATLSASSPLASPSLTTVGYRLKVRKPTLSSARRSY